MSDEELAEAQRWISAYVTAEEAEGETAALAGVADGRPEREEQRR